MIAKQLVKTTFFVTEVLLIAVLGTNSALLFFMAGLVFWAILRFRRARRLAHSSAATGKIEADQLIDELLEGASETHGQEEPGPTQVSVRCIDSADDKGNVQKHRERLPELAVGGQARQYGLAVRGKSLTADQVDTLDDSEVKRLYARYEARLGAVMTKTQGSAALKLYAGGSTHVPAYQKSAWAYCGPWVRPVCRART